MTHGHTQYRKKENKRKQ